jgi:hypothetical protein
MKQIFDYCKMFGPEKCHTYNYLGVKIFFKEGFYVLKE